MHKVHVWYITKRLFDPIHGVNQKHRKKLRHIFFNAYGCSRWTAKMQNKRNITWMYMQCRKVLFPSPEIMPVHTCIHLIHLGIWYLYLSRKHESLTQERTGDLFWIGDEKRGFRRLSFACASNQGKCLFLHYNPWQCLFDNATHNDPFVDQESFNQVMLTLSAFLTDASK